MARTFPLTIAEFWDTLGKASVTADLTEALAFVGLNGGSSLPVDTGPRLWTGSVSTRLYRHDQVDEAVGLIEVLREGGATFRVTKALNAAPKQDPDGAILGAANVTISAKPSAREISLTGLPDGYVLSRGDMISWSYNSAKNHALHRIVDTVTAQSGQALTVEVRPNVRGDPVGSDVELISPSCVAMLVPGSYSPPEGGPNAHSGLSFNYIQVNP